MRWAWLFAALCLHAAEPGYVDPAACWPCHTQIFEAYRKTGMGRSFAKAVDIPRLAEFFHKPSERYYSVVERSDGTYLRRSQATAANIIEKRIDDTTVKFLDLHGLLKTKDVPRAKDQADAEAIRHAIEILKRS